MTQYSFAFMVDKTNMTFYSRKIHASLFNYLFGLIWINFKRKIEMVKKDAVFIGQTIQQLRN